MELIKVFAAFAAAVVAAHGSPFAALEETASVTAGELHLGENFNVTVPAHLCPAMTCTLKYNIQDLALVKTWSLGSENIYCMSGLSSGVQTVQVYNGDILLWSVHVQISETTIVGRASGANDRNSEIVVTAGNMFTVTCPKVAQADWNDDFIRLISISEGVDRTYTFEATLDGVTQITISGAADREIYVTITPRQPQLPAHTLPDSTTAAILPRSTHQITITYPAHFKITAAEDAEIAGIDLNIIYPIHHVVNDDGTITWTFTTLSSGQQTLTTTDGSETWYITILVAQAPPTSVRAPTTRDVTPISLVVIEDVPFNLTEPMSLVPNGSSPLFDSDYFRFISSCKDDLNKYWTLVGTQVGGPTDIKINSFAETVMQWDVTISDGTNANTQRGVSPEQELTFANALSERMLP